MFSRFVPIPYHQKWCTTLQWYHANSIGCSVFVVKMNASRADKTYLIHHKARIQRLVPCDMSFFDIVKIVLFFIFMRPVLGAYFSVCCMPDFLHQFESALYVCLIGSRTIDRFSENKTKNGRGAIFSGRSRNFPRPVAPFREKVCDFSMQDMTQCPGSPW